MLQEYRSTTRRRVHRYNPTFGDYTKKYDAQVGVMECTLTGHHLTEREYNFNFCEFYSP